MFHINKLRYLLLLVVISASLSCNKFLNVTPNNNLSGNNFWTKTSDYEGYTAGLYNQLRSYLCNSTAFFMVTGEFRYGLWENVSGQNRGGGTLNDMLSELTSNNMNGIYSSSQDWVSGYGYSKINDWATWYTIIQDCNILQAQVAENKDDVLSANDQKRYNAEAVFVRNLCYFLMVRLYGDVPYYTEAYASEPTTRTAMKDVVNNCVEDLKSVADDLPWTLVSETSGYYATRASRAAVYALIMNLDMWNATFDSENKTHYYQETDSVGSILINQNEGYYQLMPISTLEQSKEIFRGFTKESIFTIPSNYNLGETFTSVAQMGFFTLAGTNYDPDNADAKSALYLNSDYLTKLYPNTNDSRFRIWFGGADNYSSHDGNFEFYKFYNIDQIDGGSTDSKILFRMADAILLRAEALNYLGRTDESVAMLNLIKTRAGTPAYSVAGGGGETAGANKDLESEIIWERLREFIGEGSFFYDVVRTKAIINSTYFKNTMTSDAFNLKAWTWPLSPSVRDQNPNITLNTYWQ